MLVQLSRLHRNVHVPSVCVLRVSACAHQDHKPVRWTLLPPFWQSLRAQMTLTWLTQKRQRAWQRRNPPIIENRAIHVITHEDGDEEEDVEQDRNDYLTADNQAYYWIFHSHLIPFTHSNQYNYSENHFWHSFNSFILLICGFNFQSGSCAFVVPAFLCPHVHAALLAPHPCVLTSARTSSSLILTCPGCRYTQCMLILHTFIIIIFMITARALWLSPQFCIVNHEPSPLSSLSSQPRRRPCQYFPACAINNVPPIVCQGRHKPASLIQNVW